MPWLHLNTADSVSACQNRGVDMPLTLHYYQRLRSRSLQGLQLERFAFSLHFGMTTSSYELRVSPWVSSPAACHSHTSYRRLPCHRQEQLFCKWKRLFFSMTPGEAFLNGIIGNMALQVVAPMLQATLNNDVERGKHDRLAKNFWMAKVYFVLDHFELTVYSSYYGLKY
jgi:hypothetical protein